MRSLSRRGSFGMTWERGFFGMRWERGFFGMRWERGFFGMIGERGSFGMTEWRLPGQRRETVNRRQRGAPFLQAGTRLPVLLARAPQGRRHLTRRRPAQDIAGLHRGSRRQWGNAIRQ